MGLRVVTGNLAGYTSPGALAQDRVLKADLCNPAADFRVCAPDENQSATSAAIGDSRGHQALFEDFLRAIRDNGTPICDGREGRKSIAVVEAIYEAARDGGPVSVSRPKP